MATTSVKLSDDMSVRLRRLADNKRRTPHWLMVEAIKRYIEQEEHKAAFYADGLASWEEFQQDGQHITWDEAKSWIGTWGTDDEQEAPQCHE